MLDYAARLWEFFLHGFIQVAETMPLEHVLQGVQVTEKRVRNTLFRKWTR